MNLDYYSKKLEDLKQSGQFRSLTLMDMHSDGLFYDRMGKGYTDFISNDYLGLSFHLETKKNKNSTPLVSRSSRLISGHHFLYKELEELICHYKKAPSALVYSCGYMANIGIISGLFNASSVIVFDEKCHRSIIDGVMLSKAKWKRFRHNDWKHCDEILNSLEGEQRVILTEGVFSMDGDQAPITKLQEVAWRQNSFLYVDESHSTGIFGETTGGLTLDIACEENVIVMSTFGKALGSYGACFSGSNILKNILINTSNTMIYTTALPKEVLTRNIESIHYLRKHVNKVSELWDKIEYFKVQLKKRKIEYLGGESPIFSFILGSNKKVLKAREILLNKGILSSAIRSPTVKKETERLRISIHCYHSLREIDQLVHALLDVLELGVDLE